jgi:cellulose synthase/poly-beta-1,6-N-acetylglucosamine synthase-like glycosyltransferase
VPGPPLPHPPRCCAQVCDDSTLPAVGDQIEQRANECRALGFEVQLVRRPDRLGGKAGALAAGVALTRGMPVEYLAVFDGGALPKPDFLYQSIYHLMHNGKVRGGGGGGGTSGRPSACSAHCSPQHRQLPFCPMPPALTSFGALVQVCMVQAATPVANSGLGLAKWVQAVQQNYHCRVEQRARAFMGGLVTYDGNGCVWRMSTVNEIGAPLALPNAGWCWLVLAGAGWCWLVLASAALAGAALAGAGCCWALLAVAGWTAQLPSLSTRSSPAGGAPLAAALSAARPTARLPPPPQAA